MSLYLSLPAVLLAAIAGFAAGMATYQKSRRWCTTCGVTLTCAYCRSLPAGDPRQPAAADRDGAS